MHFNHRFGACSPINLLRVGVDFELTFLIAINNKNIGCCAAIDICYWNPTFIHDLECSQQVKFSFPTMHHVMGSGQPHQPAMHRWACTGQT